MNCIIRKIKKTEYKILEKFLYNAIFIPKGSEKPPKSIIQNPDLQVYIEHFGEKIDDKALVALVEGQIVGAVWTRIINDYGHIYDDTPSMAISVLEEYRNLGIGTNLIKSMLSLLQNNNYRQVSLSVQKDNYAINLYKKVGFATVKETPEEFIMVCEL